MPLVGGRSGDLTVCRNNEASVDCSIFETDLYEHVKHVVSSAGHEDHMQKILSFGKL